MDICRGSAGFVIKARVKYIEKHYGQGNGSGERVLDPVTDVKIARGSRLEMESYQIREVDPTRRVTRAQVADDASFISREVILTEGHSEQAFYSVINGNNTCRGHSTCNAIITDQVVVKAVPDVTARHVDAALIQEATIGKIAGDQITKLMPLGLSEEEAEQHIVNAFLR